MVIHKLEREATAQIVIRNLPKLWNSLNHLVTQLQNASRTYSTAEIIDLRNGFINNYNIMNNFNTTHGVWFASRYPEFATALTDAITALQNINNVIINGLKANYWDAELDKPVIMDISQAHRNALATNIAAQLE